MVWSRLGESWRAGLGCTVAGPGRGHLGRRSRGAKCGLQRGMPGPVSAGRKLPRLRAVPLVRVHSSRCARVPRIRGPAESGPGSRRPGPRHCRGAALASRCVASGRLPGRPPPNPGAKLRFLRGFPVHPGPAGQCPPCSPAARSRWARRGPSAFLGPQRRYGAGVGGAAQHLVGVPAEKCCTPALNPRAPYSGRGRGRQTGGASACTLN